MGTKMIKPMTESEKIALYLFPEEQRESSFLDGYIKDVNAEHRAVAKCVAQHFLEVLDDIETPLAVMKEFYKREHGRVPDQGDEALLGWSMSEALRQYAQRLTSYSEIAVSERNHARAVLINSQVAEGVRLKNENRRLKALLKEADEYLNTNKLTSIGHGSILHRKIKEYTMRDVTEEEDMALQKALITSTKKVVPPSSR